MVAQVTRPLANGPQIAAPTTLQGGAYTLGTSLCSFARRTLYSGHQRGIERPVLIERVDGLTDEVMQRAVAGKAALLNLCHLAIAQALDVFVENDALYTVMCAGEGMPLAAQPMTTPCQAVAYGIFACNALGFLANHHQHLAAADISPATVFVTCAGRARLTSLAALLGAHTSAAESPFAAPNGTDEQALVFSIGATLHHALSGWNGSYGDGAPTLGDIAPDINTAIMRALDLDPAKRFDTVAALRFALLRAQ
jgi:serine/threonine protein kinase